jgi:hypothetical protein
MVVCRIVPSFGIEICHSERISNNSASNPSSTLSYLVDQQDARSLVTKRSQERPLHEEIQRVQCAPDRIPILLKMVRLSLEKELLKGAIEFADGFLLIDALVALKAFDNCFPSRRDRLGKSRLAAPRWSFDDDRLLHARSEVHNL